MRNQGTHSDKRELLGTDDLRQQYNLGRDFSGAFMKKLPHIVVGKAGPHPKVLVRRVDVEAVLARASAERADLWALIKSGFDFSVWLDEETTPVGAGVV